MSSPHGPEHDSGRPLDPGFGNVDGGTDQQGADLHHQDMDPGLDPGSGVLPPLGYDPPNPDISSSGALKLTQSNSDEILPDATPPCRNDERNGPAWEWVGQIGFFRAFYLTIKEVLFSPGVTFRLAIREGSLGKPLGFYVMLTMLSYVVTSLYIMLLLPALQAQMEDINMMFYDMAPDEQSRQDMMGAMSELEKALSEINPFKIASIGGALVGCFFKVFIYALLGHGFLAMFGGTSASFEATFRVFAYAMGAAAVIAMIPFCGQLIAWVVWLPIILFYGLREVHETETWRVMMTLIVGPLIILVCCCGCPSVGLAAYWPRILESMGNIPWQILPR